MTGSPRSTGVFGTGYVTMDQVRQHYADPGKFNGHA
jgi:hypothetical protein